MGARQSFYLRRDKLDESNSRSVALGEILGYFNGAAAMAEIRGAIHNNWNHRGKASAKKELVVVMYHRGT